MQSLVPPLSESSAERTTSEHDELESNQFVNASPSSNKLVLQAEFVAPHLRFATVEGEPGAGKQTLARFLYRQAAAAHDGFARSGFRRCDAREWLLWETDPRSIVGFTYLDRVDLLAPPGQALLLRILKNLDTRKTGSSMLLASTESSLRDLAASGAFLSDLAFRLTAIRFVIPPLRERREDILPLATMFLDRIRLRYKMPRLSLSSGAASLLVQHHWPGNVRELSSVLESAVLECTNGVIGAEDLSISPAPAPITGPVSTPESLNLDAVIQRHLRYVLELNYGNKQRTARQLGISRSTLYRMLDAGESTVS